MLTLYRRWPKLSIITGVGALIQARNINLVTTTIAIGGDVNAGGRVLSTYTIPEGGVYFFNLHLEPNCLGHNIGDAEISIQKNSTHISRYYLNNAQQAYFVGGQSLIRIETCNAGDVITSHLIPSAKVGLSQDADRNYFSVTRIS